MFSNTLTSMFHEIKTITDKGITFIYNDTKEDYISYQFFHKRTLQVLNHIQKIGLKPGDEIVFQIEDNKEFLLLFWACILGGILPIPVTIGSNEAHRLKLINIIRTLNNPYVATTKKTAEYLHQNSNDSFSLFELIDDRVIIIDDINLGEESKNIFNPTPGDIAFIQFSSGSTGTPKGVVLTHENLFTNVEDIIEGRSITDDDSQLSWMPLTHDMGLIICHIMPIKAKINQYNMNTNTFIHRPSLWLKKASEHKVTIISSPNFGYKHFLSLFKPKSSIGWDLSNVKTLYNGAEPISGSLCDEFFDAIDHTGIKRNIIGAGYGLAEGTVAVAITRLGEDLSTYYLDREFISIGSEIREVSKSELHVSFVSVGKPMEHCEVRICNTDGEVLKDRTIGHIQIKGKNVTRGYYNNTTETERLFTSDGWLITGDLGFIDQGKIIPTGRYKDIIIVNGQNYYPHDIERTVTDLNHIDLGKVVACGAFNEKLGQDEIIIFIYFKNKTADFVPLSLSIKDNIATYMNISVAHVIPIRKVPKTTSGKVQRYLLSNEFKSGVYNDVIEGIELHNKQVNNAPEGVLENKLADIWCDVLNIKEVGRNDHFFALGGNSLKASILSTRLQKEFGKKLNVINIFESPILTAMAKKIEEAEKVAYPSSIERISGQDSYPITSAQKRLLVINEIETENTIYNIPFVVELSGPIKITELDRAWKAIVQRHESLRTSFTWVNEELVQRVHHDVDIEMMYVEAADDAEAKDIVSEWIQPFDLSRAPLCRVGMVRLADQQHLLFFDIHHSVSDGTSMGILLKELMSLYQGEELPEVAVQYKDFAVWQQEEKQVEVMNKQEDYWLDIYAGEVPALDMPTDYTRPLVREFKGDAIQFTIESELGEQIRKMAARTGSTVYMVLLAAYNIMLSKYTGQEDIVVGTATAGRTHADVEQTVGMFINTLALRHYPAKEKLFEQFLEEVKEHVLQANEHQNYPFEQLVERLGVQRDAARNPLFDTMFVLQNMDIPEFKLGQVTVKPFRTDHRVAKFDLLWEAVEEQNGVIECNVEYSTSLYKKETIERMTGHFVQILRGVVEQEQLRLSDIEMVTAEEKKQLVYGFNQTQTDYPKEKTLHALFEEQVKKTPHHVAVVKDDETLTYAELNAQANQVARVLRRQGVEKNSIVGLLMESSIERMIGMLGILKAGGAYLPIDSAAPLERIQLILEDSGSKHIIVEDKAVLSEITKGQEIWSWKELHQLYVEEEKSNLGRFNSSSDLAYVMYTSGSTGVPKGNLTMHYNVSRVVKETNYIEITDKDSILQLSNFAFDGSTFDIYGALLNGAKLVLLDREKMLDPEQLGEAIQREAISTVFLTTALFNVLVDEDITVLKGIKQVLTGGENHSAVHIQRVLQETNCRIMHVYGPTESTVFATAYEIPKITDEIKTVPIGRPLSNTEVYVVNGNKLQPIGVVGELCIGGDGLVQGYMNRLELTAEKFVANPFKPGEKMYRSGDLARWLPDGTLEYMGRMDHQVKIRGYRIECGEIEAQLLKHESVNETLVMARESEDGSKYLAAYIVSETQVDVTELRRQLEKHVPSYMVPAYFIQVERMPLTANGKVDRKALPFPEEGWMRGNEYVAPQGEMEEKLAEIWKEVLGIEQVGRTDNFFELGGDSIKAVQVSARLQRHGLKMGIRDLFQNPSVEQVSPYLKSQNQLSHQGAVEGEVELSPIQQWFFEGQKKAHHHFNHSVMLYRKERYREDIVQQVMQRMMEHHDALRMVYEQTETGVYQYNKVIHELLVEVPVIEVRGQGLEEVERLATRIQESIDLEKGPMMRLGLFRADDGDHLLIVIHHLVVDGVSWRILLEDFASGYTQALKGEEIQFQAKTASYQEWSSRMKEYTRSEAFAAEKSYWRHVTEAIVIGTEVTAQEVGQIGEGKHIEVQLDEDMTEKVLRQVNQAYNTEINDILVTALALSIHEWDGREEICIDMEGHGREELVEGLDITRTVGWFTSIYPVTLQVKEQELGRQIKTIKEALRSIPNKGIGYGMYRYWSEEGQGEGEGRKVSGISFNYLGQFDQDFQTVIFEGSSLPVGVMANPELQRNSALEVNGIVKEGRMRFTFGYNGKQYCEQEMENLAGCYMQKLTAIIEHCVEKESTELTPSDVMAHDMSIEEIEDAYVRVASKGLTVEKMYPLAPLQEGMLFHHVMNKGDLQYFVQTRFEVRGSLDIDLLEQSYQELINRHDVLRSIFIFENIRRSLQVVIEQWKFIIDVQKIANKSDAEQEEAMSRYMEEDKNKGFDLTTTIPMRVAVFEMGEQQFKVIWSFHHIVIDGWCMSTLFTELLQIYESLNKGTPLQLETAQPYSRFIQWLEKQDKAKASDYWKNYLKTIDEVTTLPGYKKTVDGYKQEELWFALDEEQTRKLQQLANQYQVTLNTMMQTIWGVVLQKYNRANEVVFGAVVSGRPAVIPGIEKMVGLFINTIPVRISSSPTQPFTEVLQAVQDAATVSDAYSSYPLYEIQNQSTLKQELINHIMVFENYPMDDRLKDMGQTVGVGLELSNFKTFEQTNYDFNVILIPGKELAIKFSYNLNAFEVGSVERMKGHVQHVMQQVIANPNATMDEIEIVTAEEKEQLVFGFNQTQTDYPKEKTLHMLFEEQVEKTPHHIAVVKDDETLTYAELNAQANQVARVLRRQGVEKNSIVGLLMESSIERMIGMLGILKAGGAYLPIDSAAPLERIQLILEDSGSKHIIVKDKAVLSEITKGQEIWSWKELHQLYVEEEESNLGSSNSSSDLAYVMYTSGSTGVPKGNLTMHYNVSRVVKETNYIEITDKDNILQLSNFAFDGSTFDIYGALLNGAKLVLLDREKMLDPEQLGEAIQREAISTVFLTTALFNVLVDEDITVLKGIKQVLTGGENHSAVHIQRVLQETNCRIMHVYGPTESTVFATAYEIPKITDEIKTVPIGRPLSNTEVYIINGNKPQPIGVVGELCIGGDGLVQGYMNRLELTAEKFVANPFKPGEKMYRSGDLARWLPDGTLEYMGRMDHQVKIRGYRIECGEIEAQLLKHESVNETLVMARESEDGSRYLAAYIVSETQVDVTELRRHLEKHVPSYMVPAYFIQVERMPLTSNGKVDRKALPLPEEGWMRGNEYVAPQGEMEEQLAEIWKEVLGIKQVGRTDNFFELGGDSIKAVQVSARLQRHGLKMEIRDLFQNPSVEQVSPYLKSQNQLSHQGAVEGEVGLSPIQQWFFEGQKQARHHFNHSVMLYRKERYREDIVQQVMQRMMEHHDALRMVYEQTETGVHQYNKGIHELLVEVPVLEVRSQGLEEVERLATRIQESIDLEKGPMMRLGLFRADDGDHLLIVIHHLVVDGVSWRILLEDFASGYTQALKGEEIKFQVKTTSYQEWSSQTKEYARSEAFAAEKSYWQQETKAIGAGTEITAEEVGQLGDGKYIEVQLDEDMTEKVLRQVNQAYNTEINDILMTALVMSIHEWDGREEICIDMEGHGREELVEGLDITRTVGWFTSIYPVILQVKEQELGRQIKTIKEALRSIPNKGIGYGMYRYWSEEGQGEGWKVSDISFNYLGQFDQDFQTAIFEGSSLPVGVMASPELQRSSRLGINGIVKEGRMRFAFGYNGKQYHEQEMENLANCYMQKLSAIIAHCVEKESTELTPSDVMAHNMSIEEIEDVYALTASNVGSGLTIEKMYPLAPLQEGMLFHHVMNKGDLQYFVQTSFEVRGNLDIGLLEQSYQELINRHDVLRSVFVFENIRRSLQVVLEQWKFSIDVQKIANKSDAEQEEAMSRYMEEDKNKGFDLTTTIPMRVAVFEMSEQQFKVIWSFHHIVIDGWCMSTLFTELLQIYEFLSKGTSLQLETAQPYSRFIQWLEKQDKAKASDYWKNYLKTNDEVTTLPGYKKTADGYKQEELWFALDEERTRKLQQLANQYQVTLNTMMQTIWGVVLQKYNRANEVVFGAVVSGRPAVIPGIEKMVGLFINTIPVRISSSPAQPFTEVLQAVQDAATVSDTYSSYPLYEIQNQSTLKQDLINHIMVFENYPMDDRLKDMTQTTGVGLELSNFNTFEQTNYDFNVILIPGKELAIKFSYNLNAFEVGSVERMKGHVQHVMQQIIANPNATMDEIEIVTAEEKEQLVYGFNQTKASYPLTLNIHQLFEEQAQKTPENMAVVDKERRLTYRQLNERANQLARTIRSRGVKQESIVALLLDRSVETIISILAVLKAGGTYLPIDPDYPAERVDYIFEDSKASFLITTGEYAASTTFSGVTFNLSEELDAISEEEITNLENINSLQDAAYIIYTSGTTGLPKGVVIEHENVIRLLLNDEMEFDFNANDVWTMFHSYCFDFSVWEMYGALLYGGKLVIVPKFIAQSPEALTDLLLQEKVTVLNQTPTAFYALMQEGSKFIGNDLALRYIIFGGEALSPMKLHKVKKAYPHTKLINMYGITEVTVHATYREVTEGDIEGEKSNIGHPIPTTTTYILDEQQKPVPLGVIGELFIGGKGIARGYLNREELTRNRFIANPFKPGEEMYRSGDLARWLPDGTLEYMGRMDHQVKIRGYRIECGEIEAQLLKHESVNETLVMARESEDGSKYLAAYIVSETQVDVTELRRHLEKHVPSYMVPAYFIQVERMPLTANGKVDRKALPLPEEGWMRGNEYVAPQGEMEEQLAEIWKEVLGIKQLGRTDNFFELGGDSIKAVQVSARLQRHGLKMEIRDLFQNPSVEQVSPYLKSQTQLSHQGAVEGEVGLSPIQQWFFEGQKQARHHFNHSVMLYRKERYREDIVQQVMQRMMEHHDALRMVYEQTETTVHQYNKGINELLVEVPVIEVRGKGKDLEEVERQATRIQESIDLEKGPMMRLGLFRADDGDHLLIVIHHLVVDGVSWRILLEDFASGYAQALKGEEIKFQAKTASYQEWSSQMKEYARSEAFAAEKSYWQQETKAIGAGPEITLEEVGQLGDGKYIEVQLDEDMTEKVLRQVNQAYNTEINDILMTALAMSIHEWDGREEICIDMEGHGREELVEGLDITRTVGWFTSIYPVTLQVKEQELGRQIKTIKEALRSIPNKGIGYGMYRYWSKEGQGEGRKVSGISFNYLGQFDQDFQTAIFEGSSLPVGDMASPVLKRSSGLEVSGIVKEGRMRFTFGYNGKQYLEQEMENLANCYMQKLSAIIAHCVEKESTELTPSDVMVHNMSIEEIEDVYALTASNVGPGLTIEKMYPLAPLQEGMLFHHVMNKGDLQYFVQTSFEVRGSLDIDLLEQSYQELINRHDVLRSVFVFENIRRSLQVVLEQWKFSIDVQKIANKSDAEQEEAMSRYMEEDKNKGFDLTTTIPMRVAVFEMSEQQFKVIWSFHHIVIDGWCMSTLFTELLQIYEFLSKGTSLQLETAQPYSRFIQWLEKQDKAKASDYWKNYLKTNDEVTTLPGYKKTADGYKQEELWFALDEEQTRKLQQLANQYQVTLNTMMQTIWGVVLQKYNRANEVVFGAVVSGRPAVIPGIEKMVGLFINTIPVRISSSPAQPFTEVLQAVQDAAIVSDTYSSYPLYEIQNQSTLKQDLINHIMVFENYPMDDRLKNMTQTTGVGLELSNFNTFEQTNYDFNVILIPGKELAIKFSYNLNAFEVGSVERMKGHVQYVIKQIIANPNATMDEIEIVTSEEKGQLVYGFNQTKTDYPKEKTLHALFEEQVEKFPDHFALVHRQDSMSYRSLNKKANQLGRYLQEYGVTANKVVGIMADRSIDMVIGILAILKAGGTYLPIAPNVPTDRMNYMLKDSGAKIVLTQSYLKTEGLYCKTVVDLSTPTDSYEDTNLLSSNGVQDLAYIMYTSGSTGNPKGVMIPHKGLLNYLWWANKSYFKDEAYHCALYSSIAFDLTVTSLYLPLITGKTLFIYEGTDAAVVLSEVLTDDKVGMLKITPSHMKLLEELNLESKNLKVLITGGEDLKRDLAERVHQQFNGEVTIYNEYGPTEATVGCMIYEYEPAEAKGTSVSIGRPADNMRVYVLDEKLNPVVTGSKGELCISGEGLAEGYLNQPELTAEKFVANPFKPGEKMYRSGDLARWLPDGTLEYMGRMDHQVKIRGYRIECGEIEAQLLKHESVNETLVMARESEDGSKYLAAYIVSETQVDVTELRRHLEKHVPSYMVPAYFIQVERMPLTANGKVDRKALPLPEEGWMRGNEYVAPQGEMEEKLAEIWKEVLGIEQVGRTDNFFELGGDSIKAVQVSARLQRHGLKMEIRDLFQNPSVEQVSPYLKSQTQLSHQGAVEGEVGLSPIQQWFFEGQKQARHHFNHSVMLYRKERYREDIVQQVMQRMMEHHDALRMVYEQTETGLHQYNKGIHELLVEVPVLEVRSQGLEEVERQATRIQESIDLEKGPMMRLGLFRADDGDHLLIVIHHLVVDGVSWRILLEDFASGYTQALKGEEIKFQAKTTSYQEWSSRMREYTRSEAFAAEKSYWQQETKAIGAGTEITLEEVGQLGDGKYIEVQLDEDMTEKVLRQVNQAYNTEINDILMTALAMSIHEWDGREEICIDMEGHGREELVEGLDITRTVGWFTSIYPVTLQVKEQELGRQIKTIKEALRSIPNKGIGYGMYRYWSEEGQGEGRKVSGISFNYLGQFDQDFQTAIFKGSSLPVGDMASSVLKRSSGLEVNGMVKEGRMRFTFGYNGKQYLEQEMENLANCYMQKLSAIIAHCVEKESTELTPSDVMVHDMSIEEIEDVYAQIAAALNKE